MKAEYKKQLVIVGSLTVLFCIGGIALTGWGIKKYRDTRAFADQAAAADGMVTGFKTWHSPGNSLSDDIHYAMVRYKTKDGREVRFQGPSKDGLVRLRQGDAVRVLYDPNDPENARVDSFMGLWFPATILCVLGVSAVLIPLLTLWQGWKWIKKQEAQTPDQSG